MRQPEVKDQYTQDVITLWEDAVRVVYRKEPPAGVAPREAEMAWDHTGMAPLEYVVFIADPKKATNQIARGQKAREKRWKAWLKSKLKVDKAAVQTQDGTVYDVPQPGRHSDVLIMLRDRFGRPWLEANRDHVQGFTLNDGTFATRKEAAKVAWRAGQLSLSICMEGCPTSLISEMLW